MSKLCWGCERIYGDDELVEVPIETGRYERMCPDCFADLVITHDQAILNLLREVLADLMKVKESYIIINLNVERAISRLNMIIEKMGETLE